MKGDRQISVDEWSYIMVGSKPPTYLFATKYSSCITNKASIATI